MRAPRLIVAAGGTGGHLWPALSLALAVKRLRPEAEFLFVGAGRPVEAKIIDPAGFPRVALNVSGLKGANPAEGLRALARCAAAVFAARGLIRRFKPDLCFTAGGYVTVPVGLAAWLARVPVVVQEQNSRPGLSNKVLGQLARRVLVGFPEAASSFGQDKTIFTGNPVRPEIAALYEQDRVLKSPPTILVTGGSQGAAGVNRVAALALTGLHQKGLSLEVVHQTGTADRPWVESVYREAGLKAHVEDFIPDMPSKYAHADLVIARAGAITLAELTAARLPSILIPLPTAADDHQTVNARRMEEAGASVLLPQAGLEPEALAGVVEKLAGRPEILESMSRAAAGLARPRADEDIARRCLELIEGSEE